MYSGGAPLGNGKGPGRPFSSGPLLRCAVAVRATRRGEPTGLEIAMTKYASSAFKGLIFAGASAGMVMVHQQFKYVDLKIEHLNDKVDKLDKKVDKLDEKVDKLGEKMDKLIEQGRRK